MDKPAQIYNCDESGSPRLLQQKGTKKVRQCTSGNKTQITILGVANAAGKVIPPMVVFSGKNWNSVWNVPHSGLTTGKSLQVLSSRSQRGHWDRGWGKHDGLWSGMRNAIDIWHSTGARLVACCQVVVGGQVGRSCDRGKNVQRVLWWSAAYA